MTKFLLDDGSMIMDEDNILQELVWFYMALFSREPGFEVDQEVAI